MCGIAGCVAPVGGRPDSAALDRMARAISHRGPDDSGVAIEGQVGLVNTRLAIVDPTPAGRQPMSHPSGRWRLTYNGEIYNHAELRRELPAATYRGHSDTETLVHALDAWGSDAVARLNGPFAFAALDATRGRLVLARDRFGKKPLYVARHDGVVWFASEMRALFAAGVPRRVRGDVLAHALAHGWPQGPVTVAEGIERLPAGSFATVDLDSLSLSVTRWYEPADSVDPDFAQRLEREDRDQLTTRLEETLREAVRRRLMSDVPLGVMCSGGLDSSLVAALARAEGGDITAFTGSVTGGGELDELPWARRVAASLGIDLETVSIDPDSWRGALVPAVDHFEYPLPHESAIPIAQISELAKGHGVKVLLTGEGADELFGGYPFSHSREFKDVFVGWRRLRRARRSLINGMARLRGGDDAAELAASSESDAFEREVDRSAAAAYAHHSGDPAALEAGLLTDLSRNVLPLLLNRMDKNAMQWSVETRVPFLDPDVVGLAVNLPLEQRVGRERKSLLRAVAARHLPAEVASRRKQIGLESNASRWFEQGARPDFLVDGSLREHLSMPVERWRATLQGLTSRQVFSAWTGEIWCRLVLEGSSARAVEAQLWR